MPSCGKISSHSGVDRTRTWICLQSFPTQHHISVHGSDLPGGGSGKKEYTTHHYPWACMC
uniref:Uncharacterized protein n=1 Tax=Octopus bimaculoides TaxID=37653 RepID=A0A0L8HCG2_OCTBM